MQRLLLIILCFLTPFANAGYDRNVAKSVDKVLFGQVDSVRYFSNREVEEAKDNGLSTVIGAIAGGVIGNRFAHGHGRPIVTIIGSVAGAAIGHEVGQQYKGRPYQRLDRLVELVIKTERGQWIDVIQDVDPEMLFNQGDKVRILYFQDGVRVDREQ